MVLNHILISEIVAIRNVISSRSNAPSYYAKHATLGSHLKKTFYAIKLVTRARDTFAITLAVPRQLAGNSLAFLELIIGGDISKHNTLDYQSSTTQVWN